MRLFTATECNLERAIGLAIRRIFAVARQQARIFGPPDRHADMTRSQQV
jgi:hypothetical protein